MSRNSVKTSSRKNHPDDYEEDIFLIKKSNGRNNKDSPVRDRIVLKKEEFKVKDYHDILEKESIESKLLRAKFSPIGKVTLGDGSDARNYIKAYNRDGIKVFILVDQHGYTLTRDEDVSLPSGNLSFSHAVKNGVINSTQNIPAGAALVCDNGICTLLIDENFSVIEENYAKDNAIVEQQALVYPIIKLSEITNDLEGVNFTTAIVNRNLVNNTFAMLNEEMNNFISCTKELHECSYGTYKEINNCALSLEKAINYLTPYHNHYLMNPPKTDVDRENFINIEKSLRHYHDNIHVLISAMQKIICEKKNITAVINQVRNCGDFVKSHYQ